MQPLLLGLDRPRRAVATTHSDHASMIRPRRTFRDPGEGGRY
jgi:hypothetical protein